MARLFARRILSSRQSSWQDLYRKQACSLEDTADDFAPLILSDDDNDSDQEDDMLKMLERLDGQKHRRRRPSKRIQSSNFPSLNAISRTPLQGDRSFVISKSFETTETEEDTSLNGKRVRWADEYGGKQLVTVYTLPYERDAFCRIVVLLIHAEARRFEFVQCEYPADERITVQHVLDQLPALASDPYFMAQKYTSLCHKTELINRLHVQDYCLQDGDVLVAVLEGHSPKDFMARAKDLLSSRRLRRAIRKARVSGRAVQRLESPYRGKYCEERKEHDMDLVVRCVTPWNPTDDVVAMDKKCVREDLGKLKHGNFTMLKQADFTVLAQHSYSSSLQFCDSLWVLSVDSIDDLDFGIASPDSRNLHFDWMDDLMDMESVCSDKIDGSPVTGFEADSNSRDCPPRIPTTVSAQHADDFADVAIDVTADLD